MALEATALQRTHGSAAQLMFNRTVTDNELKALLAAIQIVLLRAQAGGIFGDEGED